MVNDLLDKVFNFSSLDDLITLKEAAQRCGLSHAHLRRLAEHGDISAQKIGRDWLTTEKSVRDYLAQNHRPGRKKKD
jgi:excisionase family DNA binding protein